MNLTVAWAPSGGWDSKTEQPGVFAQAAELSRRTDSHVNLPRLRASRSLKDFQECLQQLGEGRAADVGEQPQWRAYQRPSEPSPGVQARRGPCQAPWARALHGLHPHTGPCVLQAVGMALSQRLPLLEKPWVLAFPRLSPH